jgi:GAF domain-containing protein
MNRPGGDMQRRGSKQTAKRPRTSRRRTRKTPTVGVSVARLQEQVATLTRELKEAREQQGATGDVLKVINQSTFDLQTVLDTLVESAVRLCDADTGIIRRRDGDIYPFAAAFGFTAEQRGYFANYSTKPDRGSVFGRAIVEGRTIHVPDLLADPDLDRRRLQDYRGIINIRSGLGVPLIREGTIVGVFALQRREPRAFTDKQIDLVETFASQAVIAIENTRLLNELRESLQQQTATADVLKVISSSPGDLEPVFNAMLEKATHICEAKFGLLLRFDGEMFRFAAEVGTPPTLAEFVRERGPFQPVAGSHLERVMRTKKVSHTVDYAAEGIRSPPVTLGGARSTVDVPLLKDNELIGVFSIYRQEVRPFTDKQIALLTNFAAQAVIAIENTRLLNELRESLQQQTATADVLKVISSSTGELQPVFEAVLENATRLCAAKFGTLYLCEGDAFRTTAMHNVPPAFAEVRRRDPLIHPEPGSLLRRLVDSKKPVDVPDVTAEQAYIERQPRHVTAVELGGFRSMLGMPMLKDGNVVGAIVIYRQEISTFFDKQIELVQNFAAQAVIAIENARLLSELRESLQQQTATADVLKVISSSPGELEPVFKAMLENATRICEATFGTLYLCEGPVFRAVAAHSTEIYADFLRRNPVVDLREHPGIPLDRLANTKQVVHIPDFRTDESYIRKNARMIAFIEGVGARTCVAVPMLKEEELVGAILIYRQEVRPFTDKQIDLVANFAAQAVIAIENTRLLNELRESLQQQTATADVLKVISRSTFDLQTVLQTLVESAGRLCEADKATITRQRDGVFYRAEAYGFSREFMDYIRSIPIEAERGSASGRALLEGRVVHIPDVTADPEYTMVEAQRLGDYRTILCVPMLREGVPIGVLALTRSEVRPFTDKQIELITTFADQAAIAIENVRLFESVEARTRELAKSLEELRTTQDRLVQTEKLASLGQLTAGIAHEIKNPLNFVNNFSGVSTELIDELQDVLNRISIDHKARAEIKELTDTLRGNLDKVVQHGKRADAIVKNMLLHSRQGSGEHRPVDINAIVEESLNLAWHGARAEKQGFNITLEKSFDPTAGEADVFPQEITRALLNLISNGFYAATKRKAEVNGGNYEPTLTAVTKNLGDRVEIRIRDNGTGIPPEVKEKLFNPFFTTKPAGEGTGLGLSISHDIIVKQHGGSIEVDTLPGEFTEIKIVLPRAAALPQ